MRDVKDVTIINGERTIKYSIGDKIDGVEIIKISDASKEYEDQYVSLYYFYDINENILKSIENCPVDVTYY